MEELLVFVLGMIAEALGLKKKRDTARPAPMSSAPPRRTMPASSPVPLSSQMSLPSRPTAQVISQRRPDAGGPAVQREATTADFTAQEAALFAQEPVPVSAFPSTIPSAPQAAPVLFADADDLVRGFILQEALGPPLCRRSTPRMP